MKYLLTFTALVAATYFQSLTMPVQTGIGISLFAGLLIFTVRTAREPWKIPVIVKDIAKLIAVLMLIAVTAVALTALADGGHNAIEIVRILVNV